MPITFPSTEIIFDEGPLLIGEICFGDLDESFESSLHSWSREQYEASWREAIATVLRGEKAALITEFSLPSENNRLWWWPLYPDGDTVYIQQHILFFQQLEHSFDPIKPFASLGKRKTHDEDGNKISEWTAKRSEFQVRA
jgi:hypothetical protein